MMPRFLANLLRVELVVMATVVLLALVLASWFSLHGYFDDGRWATPGDFKAIFGLFAAGLVPATIIFAPLLALYRTIARKPRLWATAFLGAVPALLILLFLPGGGWRMMAQALAMLGIPVAIAAHFALGLVQRIERNRFATASI